MKRSQYIEDLKRLSDRTFRPILEEAGFQSYRNELLSWFREIPGEGIIQHFHLALSSLGILPIVLFYYGIHPTYLKAPFKPGISMNEIDGVYSDEIMERYFHHNHHPNGNWHSPPDPDSNILAQMTELLGAEVLEDYIFPLFSEVKTREAAYQRHLKNHNYYVEHSSVFIKLSPELIDEVVYYGNRALYKPAIESLKQHIDHLIWLDNMEFAPGKRAAGKKEIALTKKGRRSVEELEYQMKLIQDGNEEEYKKHLLEREHKYMALFHKEFEQSL